MINTKEILIRNLVNFRHECKMSQSSLSEKAGISLGIVSEIENGHRNPNLETLDKIASALNKNVYDLFYDPSYSVKELTKQQKVQLISDLVNDISGLM